MDLEVLVQHIHHSLGLDPTLADHRRMFYMLANFHHQVPTSEALSPAHHLWYHLSDLPL